MLDRLHSILVISCLIPWRRTLKTYMALFLASSSLPLAAIGGIFAFQFGMVWNVRQALAVGVLICSVVWLIAFVVFLLGMPKTLKRLRTQAAV